MKQYYVYLMASKKKGTLYTGVTNDLQKRVWEHKNNKIEGFTKRYGVHNLVYYEKYNDVVSAITREKQIKAWKRQWKIDMIEKYNPDWNDLFDDEDALLSFQRKLESTTFIGNMDSKSSLE